MISDGGSNLRYTLSASSQLPPAFLQQRLSVCRQSSSVHRSVCPHDLPFFLRPRIRSLDQPRVSIDHDTLSTANALSCYTCAQDCGDVILASHDGTVAERTAYIGDDSRGKGKEWCPGGRCDPCHENIAWSHVFELLRSVNDSRRSGDTPRAGRNSFQYIPCGLVNTRRGKNTEVNAQEAETAFERQGRWRRNLAFAFPGCSPLSYGCVIIPDWLRILCIVKCMCSCLHLV